MKRIKGSMLKSALNQLRKHYSETEEHLICLTCEAIIGKGLIDKFLENLRSINVRHSNHIGTYWELDRSKFYEVIEKWKKLNKKIS